MLVKRRYFQGFAESLGIDAETGARLFRLLQAPPLMRDDIAMPKNRYTILYGGNAITYAGGAIMRYIDRNALPYHMVMMEIDAGDRTAPLEERKLIILQRLKTAEKSRLAQFLPPDLTEHANADLMRRIAEMPDLTDYLFKALPKLSCIVWTTVWNGTRVQLATLRDADAIDSVDVYGAGGNYILRADDIIFECLEDESPELEGAAS